MTYGPEHRIPFARGPRQEDGVEEAFRHADRAHPDDAAHHEPDLSPLQPPKAPNTPSLTAPTPGPSILGELANPTQPKVAMSVQREPLVGMTYEPAPQSMMVQRDPLPQTGMTYEPAPQSMTVQRDPLPQAGMTSEPAAASTAAPAAGNKANQVYDSYLVQVAKGIGSDTPLPGTAAAIST